MTLWYNSLSNLQLKAGGISRAFLSPRDQPLSESSPVCYQTCQTTCSEHKTIAGGFGLIFPYSLAWISVILQQKAAACFFSSVRRHGGPWGSMRRNFLTRHTSCMGLGSKKKDAPLKPDLCQPVMLATKRSPFTKGDPTPGEHCACFPPVFQTQALSHHPAWQEYMTQHMFSCLKLKMSIGKPARLAETKEFFLLRTGAHALMESPLSQGTVGLAPGFPA